MLQFHLSKILAQDLKMHVEEPVPVSPGALQWYGHRITVMHRKCVLMMEYQSRYCMVFAGLTKPDFENFPRLFSDRLWREVVSICELDDAQSEDLAILVNLAAEQQYYQVGSDRSVQAHLRQAADEFEILVYHHMGRLPERGVEEFNCGAESNKFLRKRKEDKDYFIPLEVFRELWIGLLEYRQNGALAT
jgi:hypothetical protein